MLLASVLISAALCCSQTSPATQELTVKGGGSHGTLVFAADGIEYRAAEAEKSQRWAYADIREFRIEGPKRLTLDLYQTRSRWRFGRAKQTSFDVTSGEITGEIVAQILARSPRAVTTTIVPALLPAAETSVPVSHRRFGTATQGTLELSSLGVLYRSSTPNDTRFWRFMDLQSVARISPSELLVTAYEGDQLRPFTFELKSPLSQEAYDTLWRRLNPQNVRNGGAR